MTGILIFDCVELGYCDQCGRACIVGIFLINCWRHKFRLCEICLKDVSDFVIKGGTSLFEKEGR
jgi:hypothetical protein